MFLSKLTCMLDWRSRIYPELTRLNQTNGRVFIWVLSGFLYRVASCVALNLSEGAGGKGREDEKKNNETSGENTRSNRLFSSTPSSRVETLLSARNSKKTKGRLEKSQSISKGDAKLRYDREIQRRPNQKHRRVRICFYLSIFLPFFFWWRNICQTSSRIFLQYLGRRFVFNICFDTFDGFTTMKVGRIYDRDELTGPVVSFQVSSEYLLKWN